MTENQKSSEEMQTQDKGFTLVEVLITLAILSIGILAVAAMQVNCIKGNSSARRITEATALVEDRVERLLELPFDHDDLDPALNPHNATQGSYTINWNVSDTDINGDGTDDSKTVTVSTNWVYGKAKNVTIVHIIQEL